MTFSDFGFFEWLQSIYNGVVNTLQTGDVKEIMYHFMVVTVISGLIAMFLYIMHNKFKHQILIDLGDHKWLIK